MSARVRFIEIRTTTAWMVDGELWRFRDGTEIAVGDANDLEGPEPMVTGAVALGLINAGKPKRWPSPSWTAQGTSTKTNLASDICSFCFAYALFAGSVSHKTG